jgi:hypothetical protein
MSASPRANKIYERALEYAKRTGIKFTQTPRYSGWKKLGLPDMRGFTPHLRSVNVYADQFPLKFNSKKFSNLWFIHDILHIAFYDFAFLNLGKETWADPVRFLESHLASEAFAVLLLDYHGLAHTAVKGLAVDLDAKDWRAFQKLNGLLPDFDSFEFTQGLVDYYLAGQWPFAQAKESPNKKYQNWLGHELRYAEKQRYYALLWLEDLNNKKSSKKKAIIEESSVAAPLWELLTLFAYSPNPIWENYLGEISTLTCEIENYFENLPKYRKGLKHPDYRLTDFNSRPQSEALHSLNKATRPSASDLFLFWQILASFPVKVLSATDQKRISTLAKQAQTSDVEKGIWGAVREICQGLMQKAQWGGDAKLASTFFLP